MSRLHTSLARLWLTLFALASTAIAMHAFAYLYQEVNPRNPFHLSFARADWWVPMHFFGAGLALLLGPLQLSRALRAHWPSLHRIGGYLYVLSVALGGVSGLALAPSAQEGWATGSSFLLLGILWLGVTARAFADAVRGDFEAHRRWMLRSLAMTFAAATLRAYLGLGIGVLGLDFASAYLAAAWLCWPLNLAVLELYLRAPRRHAVGRHSAFRPADA